MSGAADDDSSENARNNPKGVRSGTIIASTYRLLDLLGDGGMGEVYEAEHVRLGRHFAVKFLKAEIARNAGAVRRFAKEARSLAGMDSEHIVSVMDCSETEDAVPYIVMERLHGADLRRLLEALPDMPIARLVSIVIDACNGLSAAHLAGIVHRDLKPENLFVTRRANGEDLCKLLDFGVAKLESGNSTAHGTLIGTIRYMAPEQLVDSASVDARADVYALGAILYEGLTGRAPHVGETVHELMFKILNQPVVPPQELDSTVPDRLGRSVCRALSSDPQARFPNAAAFAEALRPFAGPGRGTQAELNTLSTLSDSVSMLSEGTLAQTVSTARAARPFNARSWLFGMLLFAAGAATGVLSMSRMRSGTQTPQTTSTTLSSTPRRDADAAVVRIPSQPSQPAAPPASSITSEVPAPARDAARVPTVSSVPVAAPRTPRSKPSPAASDRPQPPKFDLENPY